METGDKRGNAIPERARASQLRPDFDRESLVRMDSDRLGGRVVLGAKGSTERTRILTGRNGLMPLT